ncbi:THUMP-like domain-containing protein [Porphyromonas loveana]|uniref:THUMP-like domain-containing protein n=1 Tax=Porphyromonas loveana TaxID=1884669 RepID=UPI0035A19389
MLYDEKEIVAITEWAQAYLELSPDRILLGSNNIPQPYRAAVAIQVELWPRLRTKLPHWADNRSLYVPSRLTLEQCSGSLAASYKRRFVCEGSKIVDLTGGLGVDFLSFMESASHGLYIEQNEATAAAARHNIPCLLQQGKQAEILTGDFAQYLPMIKEYRPDCIFVDPARRAGAVRRVYAIADCEPDLRPLAHELLPDTNNLVAKLSPMIDVLDTMLSLPYVRELHIVAVRGEVKELLVRMSLHEGEALPIGRVPIHAVNLTNGGQASTLQFTLEEEQCVSVRYADSIETYIYEPHAAVLKAGAFKSVAHRYNLSKLHPNSHIYTSSILESDFPGRTFVVEEIIPFTSSTLKRLSQTVPRASISCRNFPLSPDELRKRSKIADGGDKTLLATTAAGGERLLLLLHKAE